MRTLCASLITVALLAGSAIGVAAQDDEDATPSMSGQVISDMVMEAWASGEDAAIEAAYDPAVVMILDGDELAADRDGIASVIRGAKRFGNTYAQVGPVSEYQHTSGDTFVATLVEVRGAGHPQGDAAVGFYRVRDGKVIRHVFMDAEHY
jgi:hypothetical protein